MENLRITGEVDIPSWFDNIVGSDGSYKRFIDLLVEIYNLELEYSKRRFFKKKVLNKIRDTSKNILMMVNKFNNSVNFK